MNAGDEPTKYPRQVSDEVAFPAARIGMRGAWARGLRAIVAARSVTSTMYATASESQKRNSEVGAGGKPNGRPAAFSVRIVASGKTKKRDPVTPNATASAANASRSGRSISALTTLRIELRGSAE